jgi:hypothetical protein
MLPLTAGLIMCPFLLTAHIFSIASDGLLTAAPISIVVYTVAMIAIAYATSIWFAFVKNQIEQHDWRKPSIWRRLYAAVYFESPALAHTFTLLIVYVYIGFPWPWAWSVPDSDGGRRLSVSDISIWGGLIGEAYEYHQSRSDAVGAASSSAAQGVMDLVVAGHESMGETLMIVTVLYVTYAEYIRRRSSAKIEDSAASPVALPNEMPVWWTEWQVYPTLLAMWDLAELAELIDELSEVGLNPNKTEAGIAFIVSIVSTIAEVRNDKRD